MRTMTANEAKTQFCDLLLKAQQAPVQINRNGKAVAVLVSADDYVALETLKLQLLQDRIRQAEQAIAADDTVDGDAFMLALMNDESA